MPLRLGTDLPSLTGATNWYNGDLAAASELKGPLLVHFWAVSCYICKKNLPRLAKWRDEYASKGLKFRAVHMPRQEDDTKLEAVERALSEFGITEICAVDNDHLVKDVFGNEEAWVPAYFLFDESSKLKSRAAGENGINIIGTALERMFSENSG